VVVAIKAHPEQQILEAVVVAHQVILAHKVLQADRVLL
jgi:hypothetical protein